MSSGMKLGAGVDATKIKLTIEMGDGVAPVEVTMSKDQPWMERWEPERFSGAVSLPRPIALSLADSAARFPVRFRVGDSPA